MYYIMRKEHSFPWIIILGFLVLGLIAYIAYAYQRPASIETNPPAATNEITPTESPTVTTSPQPTDTPTTEPTVQIQINY